MAHCLDVVAVRPNDESGVVVRMVVRAEAGSSVIFTARCQCREIEGVDLRASGGGECQVKMRRICLGFSANAQGRDLVWSAKLDAERALRSNGYTKRLERLYKEGLARSIVAYSQYDVIKHESSGRARPVRGLT